MFFRFVLFLVNVFFIWFSVVWKVCGLICVSCWFVLICWFFLNWIDCSILLIWVCMMVVLDVVMVLMVLVLMWMFCLCICLIDIGCVWLVLLGLLVKWCLLGLFGVFVVVFGLLLVLVLGCVFY